MARPSKLTPETQKKICKSIKLGSTYELACKAVGISYSIFREWIRRGEEAKSGKFFEFSHAVKKAEGEAVNKWLEYIESEAKDGNWQAAAWKLERRYPADYGKQIKSKVESQNIEINWNDLTDEQIKRLANGENIAAILADGG